jgi:arabinan endo-1,5-alpha-L-arabinosidase
MTRGRVLLAVVVLIAVGAGGLWGYRTLNRETFTNPVLHHNAPDPVVIKGHDGFYYTYTTQSDWPTLEHVPVLRSRDLVHWKHVGDALPELPRWVTTDIWAPHVIRIGDIYNLYISARQFGSAGFAIGVATSTSPTGPFEGRPRPILRGPRFTTIDPFVMTTEDGDNLIYWGSNSAPLRVQRLTDDGLDVMGRPTPVLHASSRAYEGLLEGAWVLPHGDHYYLMYSGDACCEPDPHYAVMVARSRSPFGPFERNPDNPILAANEDFLGPGHNATIRDRGGRDWILYHAFDRSDTYGRRMLFLDVIEWDQGWPVINRGSGPSGRSAVAPEV